MEKLTCKKIIEGIVIDSPSFKDEISITEALTAKFVKKIDKNYVLELVEGGYVQISDPKNMKIRYKHMGGLIEKKTCQELVSKLNVDDSWDYEEISVQDAIDHKFIGKMDRNNIIELGEEGFIQIADPENVDIRYRRFGNFVEKMTCRELIGELDHSQFLDVDAFSVHDAVDRKIFGALDKNHIVDWLEVGKIEITDPKNVQVRYPLWPV